jgi:DNA-binding transcriptional regulator YdaS (Cro superfamily)
MKHMPEANRRMIEMASAVFGPRWQRPLAEAMGVHQKQMNRWAQGHYEIPQERLRQAIKACTERAAVQAPAIARAWAIGRGK